MNHAVQRVIQAIAGLRETVRARDHLDVQMERAPKVICMSCGGSPYYLNVDSAGVRHFAPTDAQRIVRDDVLCPLCGNNLCARMGGTWKIKTDRGWM